MHKYLILIGILLYLISCAGPVTIGGEKYERSQLALLKIGKTTRIVSVDNNQYKENMIYHPLRWLLPGEHKIGAIYYSSFMTIGQNPGSAKLGRKIITARNKHTQYITRNFEPGKKYQIYMSIKRSKEGNKATPRIYEIKD